MAELLTRDIFNEEINNAGSICIMGHVNPDGDCMGAVLGCYNYIKNVRGADFNVKAYLDDPHEKFSYLSGYYEVCTVSDDKQYDLSIVLDCASMERLGRFKHYCRESGRTVIVDHHMTNEGFGDYALIEAEASSSSEVLYGLLEDKYFDLKIAECIYTGIIHDTGVFRHGTTHRSTMEIAGRCMELGVKFGEIIEESFFSMTFKQKKVLGYLLTNMKQALDGKLVYAYIDMDTRKRFGAESMDMDGMIDNIRTTTGAIVAVYLYETIDGRAKASLRSNSDLVDVSSVAVHYGGGGHKRAAGCFMSSNMEKNINELIELFALKLV